VLAHRVNNSYRLRPMATAPVTDGRSARSQRTRTAVVDALLDLNRGGNLRPTAKEIAERAGVSLRSVYVHFDDLEDLFLAAAKRHTEAISGMLVEVPATGPLRSRAETLVRMRSRIYEEVGNIRRAAELQAPFSPTLETWLAAGRSVGRRDLERVFANELDHLSYDARKRRLAMVHALAGGQTWDQLRQPLDVAAARKTAVDAIIAVLEREE
jgi:TetR/AcrR family transcriptional regulator, regulator of autoinduction and epiphytic fitness